MAKHQADDDTPSEAWLEERDEDAPRIDPKLPGSDIAAYLRPFRSYPPITSKEDFNRLYDQWKLGKGAQSKRAFEMLFYGNVRLVLWVIRQHGFFGLPRVDMISVGMIGVKTALERFDPDLGYRFSTYAQWWIRQAIHREIQDTGTNRIGRLPVHVQDVLSLMRGVELRYANQHGRVPNNYELYLELQARGTKQAGEISLTKIARYRKMNGQWKVSLQQSLPGTDGEVTLEDVTPDLRVDPDAVIEARRMLDTYLGVVARIEDRIATWPPREADIARSRLGLNGNDVATLEELGLRYDLTRERIRQIETDAYRRLTRVTGLTIEQLRRLASVIDELAKIVASV